MGILTKKDRQILYQLDQDSRQSNSQIARRVRLSKEVVGYRIARLEREGVIRGFYTLVDTTKLGYLNARIFIKLKNISPADEARMVSFFEKNPRCWWVNSISGSFTDMGIAFWVKDIADFHSFKEELLDRYRGNMEFYRESLYSAIHVWRREYLSGRGEERKYDLIPGSSPKVHFDAYDLKLLSTLAENARMPIVKLAELAGLSATAAKYRMKKLWEKGVILGFRPKIDLGRIGCYWYKVEFQLEDNRAKRAMLAYFYSHPNVVYAYESVGGGTELEVEMEVESHQQFREVVDGMRVKFRNAIRTYAYYLWSAEHKIVFSPPAEFLENRQRMAAGQKPARLPPF